MNAVPGAHLPAVLHWYRLGLWNIFITCLIYFTFSLQETVSFVHCAAGNTCSILAVCYGMGYVGSWTLWSLWVPSKWRHSVVYGNKSGADAESGSVYLGMFEMVPLSDCFSVPPCKCCPCCRMVSGGELAAFWCNSQLGCSDTGATPCSHYTRPAPAAPPEPQQMIHFCLEAGWTTRAWQRNLSAHSSYIPRGEYWLCLKLILSSPPAKYAFTLALDPAG